MHNVKNNAVSTLAAMASAGATTIVVAADDFPAAPFYISLVTYSGDTKATVLGNVLSVVEVTSKNGTTFTCSPVSQTCNAGTSVELRLMAEHIQELEVEAVVKPVGNWQADTMNLRAALASKRPIKLHPGVFYLDVQSQSDAEILLIDSPRRIVGAGKDHVIGGHGTQLVYRSSIGSSVDVIRCTNYDSTRSGGIAMRDFAIIPENGAMQVGRNVIRIQILDPYNPVDWVDDDLGTSGSATPTYNLAHSEFHNIYLKGGSHRTFFLNNEFDYGTTPDSEYLSFPSPTHDAFYLCSFTKVVVTGTMLFHGCGDSIQIDKCNVSNMAWGQQTEWNLGCANIEFDSLVPGANVIAIRDCNMTGASGLLKLTGDRFYISNNNLEQYNATLASTGGRAVIDLRGNNNTAVGKISKGSSILGNQVTIVTNIADNIGNGNAIPLLQASDQYRLYAENNHFCFWGGGGAALKHVVLDTSCNKTVIGAGNMYMRNNTDYDPAVAIANNGANTKFY